MHHSKSGERKNHQTPKHKENRINERTGFWDESCNMKLDTDYGRIRENHKIGCVWNGIIYNKLWKVLYLVVFKSWKSFFEMLQKSAKYAPIWHSLFIMMLMMNRTYNTDAPRHNQFSIAFRQSFSYFTKSNNFKPFYFHPRMNINVAHSTKVYELVWIKQRIWVVYVHCNLIQLSIISHSN